MNKIYDITIVGAGIVGLATAYKLIQRDKSLKLLVVDKESSAGQHQSSHNSGVIHSGIYYTPGSLKAQNCINGYKQLLAFCDEYNIEYDICGKIIVATKEEEKPKLNAILKNGLENGLEGVKLLTKQETLKIEPHVNCVQSIYVPQAGIIDYKEVMSKLVEILKDKNVDFAYDTKVKSIDDNGEIITIHTTKNNHSSKHLISCAGLYADKVASMSIDDLGMKIVSFRGEYYSVNKSKEHMINNLIYPVPNPDFPFLGVHYTRKMTGGIEAGPNAVLAFRREGYSRWDINLGELLESLSYSGFLKLAAKFWRVGFGEMYRSFSSSAFAKALQHLITDIGKKDLKRSTSGVRAQALYDNGGLVDDFLIKKKKNIIHVLNAPSPAATSCMAIGEHIANLVEL